MDKIKSLLKRLDENDIKYSADEKFEKDIPKFGIPKGVNELGYLDPARYPEKLVWKFNLKLDHNDLKKTTKILRDLGFIFFPKKSAKYFIFDVNLGFICIDLGIDIDKNAQFNGRLICFVGPEGSGKTTTLSAVYTCLENFPVKKELMTFSSFKDSKIWRVYDLGRKLILSWFKRKNLVLTDRYIYLTFRKNEYLRKILRFLAPKPDIVFIMESDYETLKKRRGPICSSRKNINQMYKFFNEAKNKIDIDTSKDREKNLEFIINKILRLYDHEEQKYFRKII